ncbi:MAG: hypothetical protein LBR47_05360 [Spirochaetaceae bacterium]|nr:hypothetical protein [Spirochaetaceae bacterium]
MKRYISLAAAVLLFCAGLYAQSIVNPSDSFYADVQVWEALGYISNLPPLKPWPEPVVRSILDEVIARGSELHVKKARYQYERLFGKRFSVGAEGIVAVNLNNRSSMQRQLDGSIIFLGNVAFLGKFFINFDLNVLLSNKLPGEEIVPVGYGYRHDTYEDAANVGPFYIYTGFNTLAAVGNERIWFQAGVSRSSWGDFPDNGVVIGPQAFHTGNASFVINQDKWNYTLAFFMLSASPNVGNVYDDSYPEKFMAMHAVGFNPLPWLSFSVYENMVYGKRFEPLYLLPISPYMISAQLVGFAEDNLQMGLSVKIKPFSGFSWVANFFLDDAHFNDLVRFNFNTRVKFAFQTGVTWIPDLPISSALFFDYTLVAPYMYTHSQYEGDDDATKTLSFVNYQDYVNKGRPLGAAIPPNSHRISLRGKFELIRNLRVNPSIIFIQHANVNESLPWEEAILYLEAKPETFNTGGGVMDYPDAGNGYLPYPKEHFMFLEQDTKQYILQLGLDTSWDMPRFRFGTVSVTLGYMFELIYNDGIDKDMYPGQGLKNADLTNEEKKQAVADAYRNWKKGLRNTINNYVSFGIRFVY